MSKNQRIERDSLGDVKIPIDAAWGPQTQRAIENFPISGIHLPPAFITALAAIKACAAQVNSELGELDDARANAIAVTAREISGGQFPEAFPVDVFQTGSGTSTNMNMNEVIAHRANAKCGLKIHPNDHVNRGQSSNDIIPSTIHVMAITTTQRSLLPSIDQLIKAIRGKAESVSGVLKTGRTHLMDALPVTASFELGTWADQLVACRERLVATQIRLARLPVGGTAVGTGFGSHPEFGARVARALSVDLGFEFSRLKNPSVAQSSIDALVENSGQMRSLAVVLTKIANDLRWMNSGPYAGLAEITLSPVQPGSSIMPGKVNPVIPEAVAMVGAYVMGADVSIGIAGQAGQFQLNTMLPLVAYQTDLVIRILGKSCQILADRVIADMTYQAQKLDSQLSKNPILVTALASRIGYEKAAKIAQRAFSEGLPVIDVAADETDIPRTELKLLLDPQNFV